MATAFASFASQALIRSDRPGEVQSEALWFPFWRFWTGQVSCWKRLVTATMPLKQASIVSVSCCTWDTCLTFAGCTVPRSRQVTLACWLKSHRWNICSYIFKAAPWALWFCILIGMNGISTGSRKAAAHSLSCSSPVPGVRLIALTAS